MSSINFPYRLRIISRIRRYLPIVFVCCRINADHDMESWSRSTKRHRLAVRAPDGVLLFWSRTKTQNRHLVKCRLCSHPREGWRFIWDGALSFAPHHAEDMAYTRYNRWTGANHAAQCNEFVRKKKGVFSGQSELDQVALRN